MLVSALEGRRRLNSEAKIWTRESQSVYFLTPNSNSDGTGISRAILVYSNVGVVEFGNVQLVKDKSDDSTAGVYIRTLTTVLVVIYI